MHAKYAGFDYTLGTRSGAHFAVVMYGTLAAAISTPLRRAEYASP